MFFHFFLIGKAHLIKTQSLVGSIGRVDAELDISSGDIQTIDTCRVDEVGQGPYEIACRGPNVVSISRTGSRVVNIVSGYVMMFEASEGRCTTSDAIIIVYPGATLHVDGVRRPPLLLLGLTSSYYPRSTLTYRRRSDPL